ncbi:Protein of unknown function [Lactobacillus helveticus CIRM-BIA 104]|uniref:Uncharacterized protein n=1 Tax=Lactobacillus helveticus CIRM-BIA 104 TaxID=1226333 RepID=U6FC22_LACHE|nr:Protein of unknown function [Lactobacillus helveticus CIRM-BIA 104]
MKVQPNLHIHIHFEL